MNIRVWAEQVVSTAWLQESPVNIVEVGENIQEPIFNAFEDVARKVRTVSDSSPALVRYVIELSPAAGMWVPLATLGPYIVDKNEVDTIIDIVRAAVEKK